MKQIISYFKNWSATRIIRVIFAGVLGIAFYYNHEYLYLFIGVILIIQAIFNISCPGGSCETTSKSDKETAIKFKKYQSKN